MKVLLLLNNYMHDFSGALFITGSLVLLMAVSGVDQNSSPELQRFFLDLFDRFKPLLYASISGIIVFGTIRMVTFTRFETGLVERDQLIALVAYKHIVIAAMVFGGAVMWARLLKRRKAIMESLKRHEGQK